MKNKKQSWRGRMEKPAALIMALIVIAVVGWSEGWARIERNEAKAEAVEVKAGMIKEEKPRFSREQELVRAEIIRQAAEYAVDETEALRIAKCESDFFMRRKNPAGSAKGVYQFIDRTWENYCEGAAFDYKQNIKCFMIHFPVNRGWWSECL